MHLCDQKPLQLQRLICSPSGVGGGSTDDRSVALETNMAIPRLPLNLLPVTIEVCCSPKGKGLTPHLMSGFNMTTGSIRDVTTVHLCGQIKMLNHLSPDSLHLPKLKKITVRLFCEVLVPCQQGC